MWQIFDNLFDDTNGHFLVVLRMKKNFYFVGITTFLSVVIGLWVLSAKESVFEDAQLASFYASKDRSYRVGDGKRYWLLRAVIDKKTRCTASELKSVQNAYGMSKKFKEDKCSSILGGYIVAQTHPYKIISFLTSEPVDSGEKLYQSGPYDEVVLFKKVSDSELKIVDFSIRLLI